jgi:hypothetical protein
MDAGPGAAGGRAGRRPLVHEIDLDTGKAFLLPLNLRQYDVDKLPKWASMGVEAVGRHQVIDELFTEYVARVVRCRRLREGVPADISGGTEKARFTVRLVPRVGKPATGAREYPQPGYVCLRQLHDSRTKIRTVEASDRVLLPPKLILPSLQEGQEVRIRAPEYGDNVFGLTAYLSPATPGWKRLLVDVGGRSFTLWDRAEGKGAGAQFRADLPQPAGAGSTTVTVVASDAGVRHKFTYRLVRAQPRLPGYDEEYWPKREERIEESWREYQDATLDPPDRYMSLTRWAGLKVDVAEEHTENEKYAEACAVLMEVLKTLPKEADWAVLEGLGVGANIGGEKLDACEALIDAAFYAGDKAAMAAAAPAWARLKRDALEKNRKKGYLDPDDFARESDSFLEVLKKCVMLGLDTGLLNQIRDHYRWCVSQTGNLNPKVDITRYLYPAE